MTVFYSLCYINHGIYWKLSVFDCTINVLINIWMGCDWLECEWKQPSLHAYKLFQWNIIIHSSEMHLLLTWNPGFISYHRQLSIATMKSHVTIYVICHYSYIQSPHYIDNIFHTHTALLIISMNHIQSEYLLIFHRLMMLLTVY